MLGVTPNFCTGSIASSQGEGGAGEEGGGWREELRGVPVLVLANKQDVKWAITAAEVADALGLESLFAGRHPWCAWRAPRAARIARTQLR